MSSDESTKETKNIELCGRTRERFEQIKNECKNDYVPAPSDGEMLKSLLDTWDAVGQGHYSETENGGASD